MAENDARSTGTSRMPDANQLAQLSPEDVAQAMEQALDEMTEDTYDQAVMDAYLDALDAKAPMPEAPDVEESYQQFQEMLSQALPSEESRRPRRRGRVLRMTLRVTLAAVFLFGCLVAAQASGVDVFGAVARWTDEVFHFEVQEDQTTSDWYAPYQEQLESVGLDVTFMPAWIPEGYTVEDVQVFRGNTWSESFSTFTGGNNSKFSLSIMAYDRLEDIENLFIEKDSTPVNQYQIDGKQIYFFKNRDAEYAVCQYNTIVYFVDGDIPQDIIANIFNSIE